MKRKTVRKSKDMVEDLIESPGAQDAIALEGSFKRKWGSPSVKRINFSQKEGKNSIVKP